MKKKFFFSLLISSYNRNCLVLCLCSAHAHCAWGVDGQLMILPCIALTLAFNALYYNAKQCVYYLNILFRNCVHEYFVCRRIYFTVHGDAADNEPSDRALALASLEGKKKKERSDPAY